MARSVRKYTKEFKQEAGKKNITLSFVPVGDLVVYADRDHTVEVINNLISNAIKYTEKGSISIYGKKQKGRAIVSVSDTGIGIKAQNQPHIFEKFYITDSWIKKEAESNGLGLYISRLLLNLMDGKITVASEVGKGSTFTFTLPLA